jgi:hypothetical protein
MRWVVPIPVCRLLSHSLLLLPLEAKIIHVTIPTTILTMGPDWFWLRLRLGLLTWLLFWFLLTWFLSLVPKELNIHATPQFDGFLKIICLGEEILVDLGLCLVGS